MIKMNISSKYIIFLNIIFGILLFISFFLEMNFLLSFLIGYCSIATICYPYLYIREKHLIEVEK